MNEPLTNRDTLIGNLRMINGCRVEGLDIFVSTLIEDIERAKGKDVDYTRALTCLHFDPSDI